MVGCTAETGLLHSLTVVTPGGVLLHITLKFLIESKRQIIHTTKCHTIYNTPVVCMVGFNFDATN